MMLVAFVASLPNTRLELARDLYGNQRTIWARSSGADR